MQAIESSASMLTYHDFVASRYHPVHLHFKSDMPATDYFNNLATILESIYKWLISVN